MLDKVTIAYRGGTYEIGRGRDYFGIWTVEGSRSQPLEWWPETQEGWSAAWTRFAVLEAPDAISQVGRTATRPGERTDADWAPTITAGRRGGIAAALLLGVGVALGIAGLFPDYLGGTSLAGQPDNLVAHVIYLAAWTVGGVLIALGGARLRVGALLAAGLSIVTFGLFLADAGTPISGGAHLAGAGLVLSLLGWLACAAGSALAFLIRPARSADPAGSTGTHRRLVTLGWPRGGALGPAVLLVLAGLGTAAAFAPSWDSFTLRTAAGQTQTFTAGNAFADPGAVIAGNVVVMVALAAVVIVAALWRPARYGAALLAGAIIPMAAQAISALVQVGEAASPAQFGLTPAQASQLGLTISTSLTPAFWIYTVLVVVLLVSCAWMLFMPLAPQDAAVAAGAAGPQAGDDADTQVPAWHVARTDAYDTTGARSSSLDDHDWDIDDDAESDELDSYGEFRSDNPTDSTVTPVTEANGGDQPSRPAPPALRTLTLPAPVGDESGPGVAGDVADHRLRVAVLGVQGCTSGPRAWMTRAALGHLVHARLRERNPGVLSLGAVDQMAEDPSDAPARRPPVAGKPGGGHRTQAARGRISRGSRSRVPPRQARRPRNGATTPRPDPRCRHRSTWSAHSKARPPDHRQQ